LREREQGVLVERLSVRALSQRFARAWEAVFGEES